MDLYMSNLFAPYKEKKHYPSMLGHYYLLEQLQRYTHIQTHTPDI